MTNAYVTRPLVAVSKISLQQYADESVVEEYRQPLKTAEQVTAELNWGETNEPMCCGATVSVSTSIGSPYHAKCEACGKEIASAAAPIFSNSSVRFLDGDQVDLDTDAVWLILSHGAAEQKS